MLLGEIQDNEIKDRLYKEFEQFKAKNNYATSQNKLLRLTEEQKRAHEILNEEIEFLRNENLTGLGNSELFQIARDSAFSSNYSYARMILRHVLRRSPNYHDARLLHGRTLAWGGNYVDAISRFNEVLDRDPSYMDTYNALTDVYYWQGEHQKSMEFVDAGLAYNSNFVPLIFRKARTYYLMGNMDSATVWINKGLELDPDHSNLRELKEQLTEN